MKFSINLRSMLLNPIVKANRWARSLLKQCFAVSGNTSSSHLDGELLARKITSSEVIDGWVGQRIQKDLAAYSPYHFSKDAIREGINGLECLAAISIQSGTVELIHSRDPWLHRREIVVWEAFRELSSKYSLPNVLMPFLAHDSLYTPAGAASPAQPDIAICTFGKPAEKPGVLIPDFEALSGYANLAGEVERAENNISWNQKIAKAIWRGTTTGGIYEQSNWQEVPRAQLVRASLRFPSLIDAKFTGVAQSSDPEWLRSELSRQDLLGLPLSIGQMCLYKYVVDVDGNACSYSRMYWCLLSRSCLLKVASSNIQWYYGLLEPYVNYIPIEVGLEDLRTVFDWLQTHDKEAELIAQRATRLAETELSREACLAYLHALTHRWAGRQA